MSDIKVAIVDYGLGNLYSVKHACAAVGMKAEITSDKRQIIEADAVFLPGVGAFGDAMKTLRKLDLIVPLREYPQSGKPLIGICLGLQLLMEESYEFGHHKGLGLIGGAVTRFEQLGDVQGLPAGSRPRPYKVPQIGWNHIYVEDPQPPHAAPSIWANSPLAGLSEGEFMYFVHSYHVQPADESVVLSRSKYGNIEFCSSLQWGTIFACQFHPERSGEKGLQIYRNIAAHIHQQK